MSELFANFEVNRQPRWKSVLALLGLSAILHLTLAASILYIPTLRDAFNIVVLARRSGYVDKAYTKTKIGAKKASHGSHPFFPTKRRNITNCQTATTR